MASVRKMKGIDHVENIQISSAKGDVFPFSFDMILSQQSEILIK